VMSETKEMQTQASEALAIHAHHKKSLLLKSLPMNSNSADKALR
jgi:hypothetical protein